MVVSLSTNTFAFVVRERTIQSLLVSTLGNVTRPVLTVAAVGPCEETLPVDVTWYSSTVAKTMFAKPSAVFHVGLLEESSSS